MKAAHVVVAALLLVGCASDRPALDEFSRAYTRFQNVTSTSYELLQLTTHQSSEYWKALSRIADPDVSNDDRARSAAVAIEAYRRETGPLMEVSVTAFGGMDSSVTALIEAANRIRNEEARARAVETAQLARKMQTALGRLLLLMQRRFTLQSNLLQGLVTGGGSISAFETSSVTSKEAAKLNADSEETGHEVAECWRKTKDAFAALKGRFNLKGYPTKWDSLKASGK